MLMYSDVSYGVARCAHGKEQVLKDIYILYMYTVTYIIIYKNSSSVSERSNCARERSKCVSESNNSRGPNSNSVSERNKSVRARSKIVSASALRTVPYP